MRQFVSVVLADTEDVWSELFQTMGRRYDYPKLVLYSNRVSSPCGFASAASGPFYCPEDHKAYLDFSLLGPRFWLRSIHQAAEGIGHIHRPLRRDRLDPGRPADMTAHKGHLLENWVVEVENRAEMAAQSQTERRR